MGIFKRLGTLIKSNANEMVNKAEDPEKMLNQAIVEMGHQMADAKKQVAEAIADEKRLQRQWEAELGRSKEWKDRAAMAVRAGDDALAREALGRKKEHAALGEEYQKQWESQKVAVEQLKVSLRALNDRFEAAKRKRNLLVAKQKRAEAQKAMHSSVSSMGEEGAFETFERMERRIEQTEAEAESAAELAGERTGDQLTERFAELEAAAGEDVELLALKEELGLLGNGDRASERPRLAGKGETGGRPEAGRASTEDLLEDEAGAPAAGPDEQKA